MNNLPKTNNGGRGQLYVRLVGEFASERDAEVFAEGLRRRGPQGSHPARGNVRLEVEVTDHQHEVPELWTPKEVAEFLGMSPTNLYGGRRPSIPEPVIVKPERGRLYLADEIREFAVERARRSDDGESGHTD